MAQRWSADNIPVVQGGGSRGHTFPAGVKELLVLCGDFHAIHISAQILPDHFHDLQFLTQRALGYFSQTHCVQS